MSDERLKILLIEDNVGEVRLIRELVVGAPDLRADIVAAATVEDA